MGAWWACGGSRRAACAALCCWTVWPGGRRYQFKAADQQKKVGNLSGGERNRLHLAKTLKQVG